MPSCACASVVSLGLSVSVHLLQALSLPKLLFFINHSNMASHRWVRNFFHGSSSSSNNHKEDLRHLRSLLQDLPQDADEQLIHFFHSKFPSPNQSTNQGQPGTKPSFLDTAKPWVEKVGNMAIDKDLTKIGSEALKIVGASNPVLCALVFVGVALERILAVNPNEEKCLRILAMMGTTIISLRDMRKHFQHSNKDVLKNALQIVLENCILCCDYLEGSRISKIWNAKSMEEQIHDAQQRLDTILASVNCTGMVELHQCIVELQCSLKELQQRNHYYVVPIDNILETESPIGLQKPIEEVCKLLSMNEKHTSAVAVIISGLGGMGKTTLASASIQSLAPSINDFKISRVIFDNTGSMESGRLSHVKMLQQQLVNNLTRTKQEFGNTADGRSKLKEVLENTSSFIFIDNVNYINDVDELLPKNLVLKQGTNLRILITSRDPNVRLEVPRICTVNEYPIQSLGSEDAKKLLHRTVMDSLDDQGQVKFPGEMQKLVEVQDLCCGIPILLHLIGTHLRDNRSLECYDQIIKELNRGALASYSYQYERVPDILLFVYQKMKDDLQIAFLDICSNMCQRPFTYGTARLSAWETVSCVVGENALENLLKKGLVQKQDKELIVHDILKTMISDEIDKYSIRNFQNTQAIKGIKRYVICKEVSEVDCQDLDLLRSSLRFVHIGHFLRVRNKCQATFVELRSLSVWGHAPPFTSLEGFTNLTILVLDSCPDMTELPSGVCSLRCLRILIVQHCSELVSFPSDLRSLTSLKMLSIAQCCNLKGLLDGMPQHLKCLTIYGCINMKFSKGLANLTSLEECHLERLSSKENDDAAMVPFKFPLTSSLKKLVLHDATLLRTLKGDFDKLQNLEKLCLGCDDVTDLSGEILSEICRYVTNLKKLQLDFGFMLKSLPEEISLLTKLHTLDFSKCSKVRAYSATLEPLTSLCTLRASGMTDFTSQLCSCLVNLEELELQNCSEEIENLPENINLLSKLKTFRLINCPGLKNLSQSIRMLSALQTLSLTDCPKLKSLPEDIGMLPKLNALFLANCLELKTLPESIGKLSTLRHLSIRESQIPSLPGSWRNLSNLHRLDLVGIPMSEFPPMFCSPLQNLEYLNIRNCVELISLPDNLCMLTNLNGLWCDNMKAKALPQDFANLTRLRWLFLCNCGGLPEDVMDIILQLENIRYLDITDSDPLIRRWRNLCSSQGIPQTNQIKVDVGNLSSYLRRRALYLWRRALHLWKMDCIRKYHSDWLQKEGTL